MFENLGFTKVNYFDRNHSLSPFGAKILQSAQKAALEAIAQHKAVGNPIYYKEKGSLIKELSDGPKYLVKASQDGIETIRKL